MAGITFTVEVEDEAARARLAQLVSRMTDRLGFFQAVGEYLSGIAIKRNFDTETSPNGTPWSQLSPLTVARREKKGQVPIRILRATQRLSASIISQPSNDEVRVGSPVEYAAYLQFGTSRMPARPFLGLSTADEAELIAIAEDWLEVE